MILREKLELNFTWTIIVSFIEMVPLKPFAP